MTDLHKRRWFRLSFSLRTLLLVAAAFAIPLGYHFNWINQRRAFLLEQVTKLEASVKDLDDPSRLQIIDWWKAGQPSEWRDPWPLRLWREPPPVYGMFALVPDNDIHHRHDTYETFSSQSDIKRARSLFPEAEEIRPIFWKPGAPDSEDLGFREVTIVAAPKP
jgi:hypothetical protein